MGTLLTTVCFSEDCSDADSTIERRNAGTAPRKPERTTNTSDSSQDAALITGFGKWFAVPFAATMMGVAVNIPRTEGVKQGVKPIAEFQSDIIARPLPIRYSNLHLHLMLYGNCVMLDRTLGKIFERRKMWRARR